MIDKDAEIKRMKDIGYSIVDLLNTQRGVAYDYTEETLLKALDQIEDLASQLYAPRRD